MWVITLSAKGWAFEYWDYAIVTSIVAFYFGSRYLEKRSAEKGLQSKGG